MRGTETIVVHRPTVVFGRTGEVTTWAAPRAVKGCIIVPRTAGDELNDRQNTTIIGIVVYAPPGTDVKATDEVTARGVRWRVDGEPGDYRSAGGQRKTVAVNLRRVEG